MLRKISAILLASVSFAYGQVRAELDSPKVVILSTRVGPVISRNAREYFMLFGYITDFRRAVVFQQKDSTFAIRFYAGKEGEVEADTTIVYSFTTLKMLSEKVDNFEALKAGTYRMGQSTPTLRFADGTVASYVPPPAAITLQQQLAPTRHFVGLLPLAADPGWPRLRHCPSFGFGIGLRSVQADFSGLSQVYKNTATAISPMITFGFEISALEVFGLQAEAAMTTSGHSLAEGWLGGAYYFIPFKDRDIRPYISAGLVFWSAEIRGSIYTDAGGTGFGIFGGVEFVLGVVAAFDIYGGYKFVPDVTGAFTDPDFTPTPVPASVSLRGPQFGVRIKFLQ